MLNLFIQSIATWFRFDFLALELYYNKDSYNFQCVA
jgi:hypothetical protein